jgi:hypothetical protein
MIFLPEPMLFKCGFLELLMVTIIPCKGATLLYADEATLSNEAWYKDIRVVQSANDSELMVRLYISDMCGYDVIGFHGHTAFPNDLQIEVAGFSSFFDLIPT